jgi:hypothetical protein
MDMDMQQRTSRRSRVALGLGTAFALSCLITVSQLIDLARGHDLGFGDVWGSLLVGVPLLLLVAGIGAGLRRASTGAIAAGAVVLAVLAWLSMVVWWVAAPAYLGIAACWVAGLLDRNTPPPRGATRTAGIVGLFAVGANIILVLGALLLTIF